jgi:predicted Zn-dependent protease
VLQGGAGGLGTFFILPVCLHEIGHILGLTHSKALDDVMAPFYVKEKLSLTEGDISRIQKMYN